MEWLPDPVLDGTGDHYLPYSSVVGTETMDEERPSLTAVHKTKTNTKAAAASASVNYFMLDDLVLIFLYFIKYFFCLITYPFKPSDSIKVLEWIYILYFMH